MSKLTESPAWTALAAHRKDMQEVHIRSLFESDPRRHQAFSLWFDDILFDYSKHRVTGETMRLLLALAEQAEVAGWRDQMFAGEKHQHHRGSRRCCTSRCATARIGRSWSTART